MEEIPSLYEGRITYFKPSLEALVKAQVSCTARFCSTRFTSTFERHQGIYRPWSNADFQGV